jgi:hypothetical protein
MRQKLGIFLGFFLSTLNWTDFAKIWKTLQNFQYQNLLKKQILLRAHSLLIGSSYKEKKVLP